MDVVFIKPGEDTGHGFESEWVPSIGQHITITEHHNDSVEREYGKYTVEKVRVDLTFRPWPSTPKGTAFVFLALREGKA